MTNGVDYEKYFWMTRHMTYVLFCKLWPRLLTLWGHIDLKWPIVRNFLNNSFKLRLTNVQYEEAENFRPRPWNPGLYPGGSKSIVFLPLTIVTCMRIWTKFISAFLVIVGTDRQTDKRSKVNTCWRLAFN